MSVDIPSEIEDIAQELQERFERFVQALNSLDVCKWAAFYGEEDFLGATAGAESFEARSEWVSYITRNFSLRAKQQITPLELGITPLAPGLTLMTSEEMAEIQLKDGARHQVRHLFTLLWKKTEGDWFIIHSHESWADE